MIYLTIILIAIIAAVCVLGCKFISINYDPKINTGSKQCIIEMINGLLDKYKKYETTKSPEKYDYHVTDEEVKDALHKILMLMRHDYNN